MPTPIKLLDIPDQEHSPFVLELLEIIRQQREEIQQLKEEIARLKKQQSEEVQQLKNEIAHLKKHKGPPQIPPSQLEQDGKKDPESSKKKRPGSHKRKKTEELEIHERVVIPLDHIPTDATFKGYADYVVQDIEIKIHNTLYRVERWERADGTYLSGKLPPSVQDIHFGPTLVSYILYQYHQCHVTQPLLLESLHEWGVDISSGQLNNILTNNKEDFHCEKAEILSVALKVSNHVNVDDTGARHAGKNGYCTHIGNEWFAWFETTNSKSRINFLELLRAGKMDYVVNEEALEYMQTQGFPKSLLPLLKDSPNKMFADQPQWDSHLEQLGFERPRHLKIATEGALLGSILFHGLPQSLVIVSDDAGQFNILHHALCWIHAERTINKIIPYNDQQRVALEEVRRQIWQLYKDLKAYKIEPDATPKKELETRFDIIFTTKTCDATLNLALKRLHANKAELLLVLERPEIPLHNNLSENDIREYVKRRKVSGSTRNELGRRGRDTFTSLKKTCRKLGVSFWQYLNDRNSKDNHIPRLPQLIEQKAKAPG